MRRVDDPILEMHEIVSGYGKRDILQGIELCVSRSETVCLLGANGSGKSTLLKTVLGYVPTRSGQLTFQERSINRKLPHERVKSGMRYVPQRDVVFPIMTVRENLLIGAVSLGSDVESALGASLAIFPQLEGLLNRRAGALSGGERQMVATARSLMGSPSLLVLDEPSAGLSPKYVDLLYAALTHAKERGISILVAEQNAAKALAFSDFGYVIERGVITDARTAEEMRHDPAFRESYVVGAKARGRRSVPLPATGDGASE